jgi:hypothetical protein
MIEPLFNNFATVAFFEFIVFAIFEMRFLLTVWRARRSNTADLWQVCLRATCGARAWPCVAHFD